MTSPQAPATSQNAAIVAGDATRPVGLSGRVTTTERIGRLAAAAASAAAARASGSGIPPSPGGGGHEMGAGTDQGRLRGVAEPRRLRQGDAAADG